MENLIFNIITGAVALVSLAISISNRMTDNRNARISRTITTIEKTVEDISERDSVFLKEDVESRYEERIEMECMEKKLDDIETAKVIEKKMNKIRRDTPEWKEELITDVLQLYKAINFFIEKDQIDSKMLAIVLQNKIESHLTILSKGIFSEKLLPSDKIKQQDLRAYLTDVSNVLSIVLKLKFYTPAKEGNIESYQANVKKYLNQ